MIKEKIRIYASNGLFESSNELIKDAKKAYKLGFRVYKMRVVNPDSVIKIVASFKKHFKNKMDLIVDAVQGSAANPWSTKVSINLAKELEKYNILFFEEPCRVENIQGYSEIKKSTELNIAGAESIPTARAFKPYLDSSVFDVLQFDIATSGFTEGRRIADLAYIHNKPIALHSWGSAISIMAGIHFSLTIPTPEDSPLALSDISHARTSYMLSKIYGEALCHNSGIPFTLFRPHNIYGPRMGMSHVIPEQLYKAHYAKEGGV